MALNFSSTSSQRLGTRSAFKGSRPRPCISRAPVRRHNRQALVVRAGLFDFLTPKPAAPAVNPRAQEKTEELIDLCSGTSVGSKASPAVKEQIEELVSIWGRVQADTCQGLAQQQRPAADAQRQAGCSAIMVYEV